VFVIENVLTPEECQWLIDRGESRGISFYVSLSLFLCIFLYFILSLDQAFDCTLDVMFCSVKNNLFDDVNDDF
jgi:hypothetical protein